MISTKTLARLTGNPADLCPFSWVVVERTRWRNHLHECVGDAGHRGKHVCPCGALQVVLA